MSNIPEWTRKFVGMEYKPPYGCWILVSEVLRQQFGVKDIPDCMDIVDESSLRIRAAQIQNLLQGRCVEVLESGRCEGDIVCISFGPFVSHVGILVNKERMLHCIDGANAVIERLQDVKLQNRISGFYRVKELA